MSERADNPPPAPAAASLAPPPSIGAIIFRSALPLAVGLVVAFLLHLFAGRVIGGYASTILLYVGINIILAVSLNMVNGFTGQFSIGHAGFMAVGGYTAAAITYYGSFKAFGDPNFHGGLLSWTRDIADFEGAFITGGDVLFLFAALVGGLFAALLGFVVGLPSLRLRGDYLAIVTLGFGEIVRVLLQQTSDTLMDPEEVAAASFGELATSLGGSLGFSGVPYYTTLFWVFLAAAITLLTAYRLKQSTHGRAFLSIRENELASEVMGVATTRYKVTAFVISSFFAGVAGALFAHQVGTSLNASELGFMKSFDVVIMVVLGGMGSISGAVLAAAIVTILPEILRQPPHLWPLGLLAIVVILIVRQKRGIRAAIIVAAVVAGWEILKATAEWQNIKLSDYRMVLYSLSLIIMMIFRPQGLLGIHEIWDGPVFASYMTLGGRLSRAGFRRMYGTVVGITVLTGICGGMIGRKEILIFVFVAELCFAWSKFSLLFRRWKDLDRNMAWMVLPWVPVLGVMFAMFNYEYLGVVIWSIATAFTAVMVIIGFLKKGLPHENRYGASPESQNAMEVTTR